MKNPIPNHITMVLNFSSSVCFLFAFAEPIVIIIIAISIIRLCSIPKKRVSLWWTALLKLWTKYSTKGLMKYSYSPSKSWICANVAVQCLMELSSGVNFFLPVQPLYPRMTAKIRLASTNQRTKECNANNVGYIVCANYAVCWWFVL